MAAGQADGSFSSVVDAFGIAGDSAVSAVHTEGAHLLAAVKSRQDSQGWYTVLQYIDAPRAQRPEAARANAPWLVSLQRCSREIQTRKRRKECHQATASQGSSSLVASKSANQLLSTPVKKVGLNVSEKVKLFQQLSSPRPGLYRDGAPPTPSRPAASPRKLDLAQLEEGVGKAPASRLPGPPKSSPKGSPGPRPPGSSRKQAGPALKLPAKETPAKPHPKKGILSSPAARSNIDAPRKLRLVDIGPKQTGDNYILSDKDTDSENEDGGSQKGPKHIPSWASKWMQLAKSQAHIDPDSIFGTQLPSCDLDVIVKDHIYEKMKVERRRRKRGSSETWTADKLKPAEIARYKKRMAQTQPLQGIWQVAE